MNARNLWSALSDRRPSEKAVMKLLENAQTGYTGVGRRVPVMTGSTDRYNRKRQGQ